MVNAKVVLYTRDEDRPLAEAQSEKLGVEFGKINLPPKLTRVPDLFPDECTQYDMLLENMEKIWKGNGVCVLVHSGAHFKEYGKGNNYLILGEGRFTRNKAALSSGSSDFVVTAQPLTQEEVIGMAEVSRAEYNDACERSRRLASFYHPLCD